MAGFSLEKIEAIAPDQASLVAARKLVKPGGWSGLSSDRAGLAWGECQGSGASPYRVVISETDAGYKCTCPSRKFPCKHSLALMWMRAEGKTAFQESDAPEWVNDWLRRRRPASSARSSEDAEKPQAPKNAAQATVEETQEVDPKAEARAAAARERNQREREDAILGGLDDLDRWLIDQVEAGLAGFAGHAVKSCRSIAQRLVDAKASGLASRLDYLPSRLYGLPEAMRPGAALEQLGQLHLLAEAYRRQTSFNAELRAEIRKEIGWTLSREAILNDQEALTVSATWRVVGSLTEIQPDKLRRLETWLWREDAGDGPKCALLLDFVPVASGQTRGTFQTGEQLGATLVFYPGAPPLRALIKEITNAAQVPEADLEQPTESLEAAVDAYENALCSIPWLHTFPMRVHDVRLRRSGDRIFVCSSDDRGTALPLLLSQAPTAAPLLALDSIDVFGLWDGYFFRLCSAETSLGRWASE